MVVTGSDKEIQAIIITAVLWIRMQENIFRVAHISLT